MPRKKANGAGIVLLSGLGLMVALMILFGPNALLAIVALAGTYALGPS